MEDLWLAGGAGASLAMSFRSGRTAEVVVTQPRDGLCFKLGIRFESGRYGQAIARRAAAPGFYLAVTREGEVGAGDEMKVLSRDPNGVSISEIVRLYTMKRFGSAEFAVVERASRVAAFPESWKEYLEELEWS